MVTVGEERLKGKAWTVRDVGEGHSCPLGGDEFVEWAGGDRC